MLCSSYLFLTALSFNYAHLFHIYQICRASSTFATDDFVSFLGSGLIDKVLFEMIFVRIL